MGSRAGSMRTGRSNTFKGLYAPRICLGVSRASTPKYSSTSAVLRDQHLETQMGGAPVSSRLLREGRRLGRPGARSGRALEGALGWRLSCARAALGLHLGCA